MTLTMNLHIEVWGYGSRGVEKPVLERALWGEAAGYTQSRVRNITFVYLAYFLYEYTNLHTNI